MQQNIVKQLQKFFPAYPIEKAWVFGSYARGEETRKSDVDVMVRFDKDAHISLFDYVGIMNDLEDLLHKRVDLVEAGQLRPWAQKSAEKDKILVYERKLKTKNFSAAPSGLAPRRPLSSLSSPPSPLSPPSPPAAQAEKP